jgi:hypothetical protein
MQELIERIMANGLADFAGLEITGSIPLKQELINEAIQGFLQAAQQEKPDTEPPAESHEGTTAPAEASAAPAIPTSELLKMVKKVEVQAKEGKLVLNFEIRR